MIGQEQDCAQLLSWTSLLNGHNVTSIGIYYQQNTSFQILHTFPNKLNIIQASVNDSHTLLAYVIKDVSDVNYENDKKIFYKTYIVQLKTKMPTEERPIENLSSKQLMVQFLYKKSRVYIEQNIDDKLLIFHHLNCECLLSRD